MTPPDDLDRLVERLIRRLAAAAVDPAAPWRTPVLASLAADTSPTLRTIVLRSVQPSSRTLRFNTDSRSDKAGQLTRRPKVELCFWDPRAAQQLRVAGDATIDTAGPAADAAWADLSPEGRAIYRAGPPPGTPVSGPHAPTDPAGTGDRHAFALVTVAWRRWDWIWLGPESHWRARVRWLADGKREADWVVP